MVDEEQNRLDSVAVEHGRFVLKGMVDLPKFVYMFVVRHDGGNCIFSKILLENKDITMRGDANDRSCEYSGATLHGEYMDYVKYLLQIPYQLKVQQLYNELSEADANGEQQRKSAIEEELSVMRDSVISVLMRYRPDAARSQAAAALVYDQVSIHGMEEKVFAVSKFDKDFTGSYYLNKLREEIAAGKSDGRR